MYALNAERKAMSWNDDTEQELLRVKRANPDFGWRRLTKAVGCGERKTKRFLERFAAGKHADERQDEREVVRLKRKLKEAEEQLKKNVAFNAIVGELKSAKLKPPQWVTPERSSSNQAIACACLGDTHFDEVVDPEQIEGLNAYSREIALKRLQKYFRSVVELGRDYFSGVQIQGLSLNLLGDIVSGNIHEELQQTNEAGIIDTCLYWSEQLVAGIEQMASYYGRVHIEAVVGNHGRLSKKPVAKNKVHDNFDYLIYALIVRHFRGAPEITMRASGCSDSDFQIYNTRYRLNHGDQFRGGSGIAGALSPLLIGDSRKRKRAISAHNPYDYLVIGHWHQTIDHGSIIGNGTLKGYDEYAYDKNFNFEPPQQSFWLTDPHKGITLKAPVHVVDRSEDWAIEKKEVPSWMAA